jgi:thiamine-monophosphate kinase
MSHYQGIIMNKEDFFISNFKSKYIGDDGAVVGDIVYSKDLFCEDIHFKLEWMSIKQIAAKSMLVNISDAIVMNAKPKFALIGVKLPKTFSMHQMKELQVGFSEVCAEFGIEIIGGDTIAGDKLDISITLISYTKKPVFRKGMKEGDLVAFTGDIGKAKRDLNRLFRGSKINSQSKFIKPKLKDRFFYEAAPFMSSALDISDGLYKELSRVSKLNRLSFDFFIKFPKTDACSGEEYEILFSFPKRNLAKILSISKKTRTKVTVIAKAKRGRFRNICKEHYFKG